MEKYNTNLKYVSEIKSRDFQYKINNKILVTNSFLYKIKRKETDLCSYCQKETESILHLFCNCERVKDFGGKYKRVIG